MLHVQRTGINFSVNNGTHHVDVIENGKQCTHEKFMKKHFQRPMELCDKIMIAE